MRRLHVFVAAAVLVGVSACTSGDTAEESTTTHAPSTTTTTSTSTTTTTLPTTTTTLRTRNFSTELHVYDFIDWPDPVTLGGPCIATGTANYVKEGTRVLLRDAETQEIAGSAGLGPPRLNIDDSGPSSDEATDREVLLFVRCTFVARFNAASIDPDRNYELHIGNDAPVTYLGDDLLNGASWMYIDTALEAERELLRLEQ